MILTLGFDAGLAALIVGLALWTILAREAFAAVIGLVAFGLLVALAWVRLAAPDVALVLALLAAFVSVAFVKSADPAPEGDQP